MAKKMEFVFTNRYVRLAAFFTSSLELKWVVCTYLYMLGKSSDNSLFDSKTKTTWRIYIYDTNITISMGQPWLYNDWKKSQVEQIIRLFITLCDRAWFFKCDKLHFLQKIQMEIMCSVHDLANVLQWSNYVRAVKLYFECDLNFRCNSARFVADVEIEGTLACN